MAHYFQRLQPLPADAAKVHELFIELIGRFDGLAYKGDRIAARQARLLRGAYGAFNADLVVIAERTAELANRVIPARYQGTRVRPPTGVGPHLAEALPTSEPVVTPLPAGVVGVVRLDKLDEFPYWKAQEFGSEHLVGKDIQGWFFGTGFGSVSAPDPALDRKHPLFRPSGTGRTMHVQNPIPEGKFIREGFAAVEAYWLYEIRHAVADAIKEINAVTGMGRRAGRVGASGVSRGRRARNYETLKGVSGPRSLQNFVKRFR